MAGKYWSSIPFDIKNNTNSNGAFLISNEQTHRSMNLIKGKYQTDITTGTRFKMHDIYQETRTEP